MLISLTIGIASKANAPSWLQLIGCTNHQAVVWYTATPALDRVCDVELHKAGRTLRKDCDRGALLWRYLCISTIQSQPAMARTSKLWIGAFFALPLSPSSIF